MISSLIQIFWDKMKNKNWKLVWISQNRLNCNKVNNFLFCNTFSIFVFLIFFEYFQLKNVSSFILDHYLIAVNFSISESIPNNS